MAGTTDLHAHFVAPEVVDRIQRGELAPHVTAERSERGTRFSFPSGAGRLMPGRMTDLRERLAHMDAIGVDVQVLSTWIDVFGYDLPEEVAVAYHGHVNEGLAAAAAAYPDRFRFFASVPLPWGDAAAAALADAVERLGAVGAMIGTNVCGANLDDPRLEPFWAASAALGVPVELHPVNVAGADRLASFHLDNFLGNPFDTAVAATSLIFGGVLDRHPDLRVILVHGGGYFPYAVGRLGHGYHARPIGRTIAREPADYLDRFCYDTIVYDAKILRALADLVTVERLVLGTDYPFDMEPPDAPRMVRETLGEAAAGVLAANTDTLLSPRR